MLQLLTKKEALNIYTGYQIFNILINKQHAYVIIFLIVFIHHCTCFWITPSYLQQRKHITFLKRSCYCFGMEGRDDHGWINTVNKYVLLFFCNYFEVRKYVFVKCILGTTFCTYTILTVYYSVSRNTSPRSIMQTELARSVY